MPRWNAWCITARSRVRIPGRSGANHMRHLLAFVYISMLLLGSLTTAGAQGEITLLCPNPIQEAMDKLVAGFEAKTGTHVKVTYGSGLSTRKTVASGQALDVSIMFAPFP